MAVSFLILGIGLSLIYLGWKNVSLGDFIGGLTSGKTPKQRSGT